MSMSTTSGRARRTSVTPPTPTSRIRSPVVPNVKNAARVGASMSRLV
jgi:hypothetical protein